MIQIMISDIFFSKKKFDNGNPIDIFLRNQFVL